MLPMNLHHIFVRAWLLEFPIDKMYQNIVRLSAHELQNMVQNIAGVGSENDVLTNTKKLWRLSRYFDDRKNVLMATLLLVVSSPLDALVQFLTWSDQQPEASWVALTNRNATAGPAYGRCLTSFYSDSRFWALKTSRGPHYTWSHDQGSLVIH